jgi:hypothetical protein
MKIIFNPFTGRLDFTGNSGGEPDWTLGYPTYDARYIQSANVSNGLSYSLNNIELGGTLIKNTSIIGTTDGGQDLYIGDLGNYALNKRLRYIEGFSTGDIIWQSYAGTSTINYSSVYLDGSQAILGVRNQTNLQHVQVRIFPSSGIGIGTQYNIDRFAFLRNDNLTSNRTFQFPDVSGTLLTDTLSDLTYAKLDGTNQPFTGDITIEKTSAIFNIKQSPTSSYFRIINANSPTWNGLYYNTNDGQNIFRFIKNPLGYTYLSVNTQLTTGFLVGMDNNNNYTDSPYLLFLRGSYPGDVSGNTIRGYTASFIFYNAVGTEFARFTNVANVNTLSLTHSIKLGNTTQTAVIAGAGSIKSVGTGLGYSNGSFWQNLSFTNSTAERTYTLPDANGTVLLDTTVSTSLINYAKLEAIGNNTQNMLFSIASGTKRIGTTEFANNGLYFYNGGNIVGLVAQQTIIYGSNGTTPLMTLSETGIITSNPISISGVIPTTGYSLSLTNGLLLGNNTQSAGTTGAGSIKYVTGTYQGVVPNTTTPTWEKFAFVGMDKNITEVATGTYNILSTDNIIDITVVCSATLPTITADLVGKSYKIFSQNIPVTINRSGGDLIDGSISIDLIGYSMVTLRAIKIGVWRIGD